LTVRRSGSGQWVGGVFVRGSIVHDELLNEDVFVAGVVETFAVVGNLQPIGGKALEALPEGARSRAKAMLYCDTTERALQTTELAGPTGADRVVDGSSTFVVLSVENWRAAGVPHRAYVLTEVAADE